MVKVLTRFGRRNLARIGLLALTIAILQTQVAQLAFAHHPEISATVDCNGLIGFTAEAFQTTDAERRENHDVRIQLKTFDGSTWSAYTEIAQGQFLPTQNPPYQFSGTFQLTQPLPEKVQLKAIAMVKWGPNETFSEPGQFRETDVETVPECPSTPGAQILGANCAEGGADIKFTNTGGGTSTFEVFVGDSLIDRVEVTSSQGSVTKTYPMVENETKTFVVKSGGEVVDSETVTFNCEEETVLGASIAKDCAEGGIRIDFTNPGQSPVDFTVSKNGSVIDTVAVGPQGLSKVYPMTEGETATFEAKSGDFTSGPVPMTFDCVNPDATFTHSCVAGGEQVTLTNTGAELPVEFTVSKNGTELEKVTVVAGGQASKTYPMAEDETSTFSVSGAGVTKTATVTHDCVLGTQFNNPSGNQATNQAGPQPTQVKGEKIQAPEVEGEALPRTGLNEDRSFRLAMVALILLLAGAGIVMTGRLAGNQHL
jgi:hypothetical protein